MLKGNKQLKGKWEIYQTEKAMGTETIEKVKKFRDPVYGYIEIEENIVHDIIDTATFQRLRNIRQTSYAPLYPSSLHNRFVHSLGVYYLGGLAVEAIERSLKFNAEKGKKVLGNLQGLFNNDFFRYKALFKLACLLHDVGHAPFSHTGEDFYLNSKSQAAFISPEKQKQKEKEIKARIKRELDPDKKKSIYSELEEIKKYGIYKHLTYLTADPVFEEPAAQDAAAHEIMSCIVALEAFGRDERYFRDDQERSFFARCITGLQYAEAISLRQEEYLSMTQDQQDKIHQKMLLNCMIQLLHSSVIDVDRLDYIIRDASTMGYQSVSVDYRRLLAGFEIVLAEDGFNFTVGFHKNAVSVIENAVYAHDNEKKWIQSHPAIIYDSYLIQQAIMHIENQIRSDYPKAKATLFCYDSLTDKGICMKASNKPPINIRYLGDADIIYLMKNVYSSSYAEEYFKRNTRKLPVWKSEAEFRNFFNKDERALLIKVFEKIMINPSGGIADSFEIEEGVLESIGEDIEKAKQSDYSAQVEAFQKKREYVNRVLALCKKYGIKNVTLLSKAFFKSNFSKATVRQIPMLFPDSERQSKLGDVSTMLKSEQTDGDKLIYLFYHPAKNREKIKAYQFARDLLKSFGEVRL